MKQGLKMSIQPLGDAIEIIMGQAPPSKECNRDGKGVPFVKVGEFTSLYPEIREWTTSPLKLANKNDILLCVVGATIGKINYGIDCAIGRSVAAIRPIKNKLDQRYLYYFLSGLTDYLRSSSQGAAQTVITKVMISELEIPLPTLAQQQRIVSILDESFAAINKAKANAEQNLKNARELFESYLQGVFEKKGEGWEERTLGDVFEIKPPKKEARDKLNDTDLVTFLPMEDLGVCVNEIKAKKVKKFKEVAGSYTYFAENDVLLAKITPCFENGKLGIARNLTNGIGFGSSEYIVFRCPDFINPEFLFYFLSRESIREDGKKYMSGAVGHKRVSKDWIENYLFSFPTSIKEQQTIVNQLDSLRTETQKLESIYQKKIADLEELKKSLLEKAFRGEIV